jgi:hypothetical protein
MISRHRDRKLIERMEVYVARDSTKRRLERYTSVHSLLVQQASIRVRLVQYVARS